jgi:hypothetical protein
MLCFFKHRWREKAAPIPQTGPKAASKEACLPKPLAFPSGLEIAGANRHDMKLVADTPASVPQAIEDKRLEHLASGQAEQAEQGLCMDVAMLTMRCGSLATPLISEVGVKKSKPNRPARERGAGLSKEPIAGSTATAGSTRHGSWLNMAELELSILARQCVSERMESRANLITQVQAWQNRRNRTATRVDWHFTMQNTRIKLKRLYPSILP